jgi:hypothetical protein
MTDAFEKWLSKRKAECNECYNYRGVDWFKAVQKVYGAFKRGEKI